jgi:hypothetical protein
MIKNTKKDTKIQLSNSAVTAPRLAPRCQLIKKVSLVSRAGLHFAAVAPVTLDRGVIVDSTVGAKKGGRIPLDSSRRCGRAPAPPYLTNSTKEKGAPNAASAPLRNPPPKRNCVPLTRHAIR